MPKKLLKPLKIIIILGPTTSGKSELAVQIACKFNGEIISADSRQVYKGLDIGSGKVPNELSNPFRIKKYFYKGIEHHLLDVASPKRIFTVAQYQKLAQKAINNIFKKNKVPIICGGTGFYIDALIYGYKLPEVKPNPKLRKKLEKRPLKELFKILKKFDPQRAKTIEKENPRRLIRAIEIVFKTGKPVPPLKFFGSPRDESFSCLMIGIKKPEKELKQRIKKRFFQWLKRRLIKEVIKLRETGISFKRIEDFGLHYRQVAKYLQGEISKKEMTENSIKEIQNYAKRQMTWFKRDKRIIWIRDYQETEKLIKEFLEK